MKKIMAIGAMIAITSSAYSALIVDPVKPIDPINPTEPVDWCWTACPGVEPDTSTCTDLLCLACTDMTMKGTNGIDIIDRRRVKMDCNTGKCSCKTTSTTYACSAGYYGTATSSSAGCTKCPDNATCAGGNNSTFVCDKVYYKWVNTCRPCPLSDNGVRGTTASTGATLITDCYLPAGTAFSDDTGSGIYTSRCYYD